MKEKVIIGMVIVGVLIGGLICLEVGKIAGTAMISMGWI